MIFCSEQAWIIQAQPKESAEQSSVIQLKKKPNQQTRNLSAKRQRIIKVFH